MMDQSTPAVGRYDVARWLSDRGVEFRAVADGTRTKYILGCCPFDANHKGKDAAIFQDNETGKLGAKCFHDSCSGNHWAEFRDKIGRPGPQHWTGPRGLPRLPASTKAGDAFDFQSLTDAEFMAADFTVDWFVDEVLAVGQPLLIGGVQKSMKTSLSLDLLISIASGNPFLGQFEITRQAPVYIVSGELGGPTLQAISRAIRRERHIIEDLPIHWAFKSPQLSFVEHLTACRKEIERTRSKVFMIDPAYLSLLSAHNAGDAGNLFSMGSVLRGFGQVGLDTGATLVLIHHFRKPLRRRGDFEPPTLEDFSFSGFAEWARQWFLLGRRSAFTPGDHRHELYFEVGGTTGQSSAWALDVNEGEPRDFIGRRWDVELKPWAAASESPPGRHDRRTAERLDRWGRLVATLQRYGSEDLTVSRLRNLIGGRRESIYDLIAEFGDDSGVFTESIFSAGKHVDVVRRVDLSTF